MVKLKNCLKSELITALITSLIHRLIAQAIPSPSFAHFTLHLLVTHSYSYCIYLGQFHLHLVTNIKGNQPYPLHYLYAINYWI